MYVTLRFRGGILRFGFCSFEIERGYSGLGVVRGV